MQHKVYILTGDIQTGKTTSLLQWSATQANVQGILTPVVDGKRMLVNIATNQMMAMEADANDSGVLHVGRFVFKQAAFDEASAIITNAKQCNYLVIDEVGPLELREEGLYHTVQNALQQHRAGNIVLVVREGLVEKVTAFFGLQQVCIITKHQLDLLT